MRPPFLPFDLQMQAAPIEADREPRSANGRIIAEIRDAVLVGVVQIINGDRPVLKVRGGRARIPILEIEIAGIVCRPGRIALGCDRLQASRSELSWRSCDRNR